MCGIAGIYYFGKDRCVDTAILKKMADIIPYRGPDDEGFYVNRNIGHGHRRLSIFDLQTGDQLMFNDSKSIALVFNGEIYNYIELREELVNLGQVFRTKPDSELIVKAYEQGGYKLKPGQFILARTGGIKAYKYWDLPEVDENNMLADREKIYEEFSYLLEDSVRIRMRSDVPYSAFLSGGLDSSSIVAHMADLSPHPVESFTIGFPETAFDVSKLALEVAERFKTNHHEGTVHQSSLGDSLKRLAFYFDEPFGDSSAIPTWRFQILQSSV